MIVAIGSVFHSLKDLEREDGIEREQRSTQRNPMPFFEPHYLEQGKNLRVLLEHQPLARKQIILWHDALNKRISSHRTNNYLPCPLDELLAYQKVKRKQKKTLSTAEERALPIFLRLCGKQN